MDDLDRQLVDLLQRDARLSMAELGRRVGLSRTATLARVRRLEGAGVIEGYHAQVQGPHGDTGHQARVAIVVRTPDSGAYLRRLSQIPEISEIESIAGEYDVLVRLACPSADRLDAILDQIAGWRETQRTTTFVVLNRYFVARGA